MAIKGADLVYGRVNILVSACFSDEDLIYSHIEISRFFRDLCETVTYVLKMNLHVLKYNVFFI